MNILFTSVGRRVELLRAFRCAYRSLNLDGLIIAIDIDPLAPALKIADRAYIVPKVNSPEYIPKLMKICRKERVNLIFPLIDPDIPVLSENRHTLEDLGIRLAVIPKESLEIVNDKWATRRFFHKIGVPTPFSLLPDEINNNNIMYPLFIKPRQGSAAKLTFKINNKSELDFFIKYVPNPIIQEFITGPEVTNDITCDLRSDILAIVSRKRIEVRWGEVSKGVTVYEPTIIEYCKKIAKSLPAVGPITVQCIMKDNLPYFTEINARFGGGLPLGIAAGVDSPKLILAKEAGLDIDVPPIGSYKVGLYITRFDDSFFLEESDVGKMGSDSF